MKNGGYEITGGNVNINIVITQFLHDDHTATMVPVFAFGPGANTFMGTYDNTQIHQKILFDFKINY